MPTETEFLQPQWPAPAGVKALCSTRAGGVSVAPFDSLNVGQHVGDEPAHTAENRARFARALGATPVYLNQVHGWAVHQLSAADASATSPAVADAAITTQAGLACTVMVADCLPVLLCSTDGGVVGAAHAGWRGLCGADGFGVLEALHQEARALAGTQARWLVWLGPCIGPSAFEVGDEVRQAFLGAQEHAQDAFKPLKAGKWLANLPALAQQRLRALGLEAIYGNDGRLDWCTVHNPSRFFSHRRDGVSGRFAAAVWRCS